MNELGHILREAREANGLTLSDVEAKTRINSRFLTALEDGNYEALPTPVHVRGFLRNYARFLRLDPQPLLARYEVNRLQYESQTAAAQNNKPDIVDISPVAPQLDQPFFDPVNKEVDTRGSERSESVMRLVIIAALLVTLYLIVSQFVPRIMGNEQNNEAFTDLINDAVEFVQQENSAADPDAIDPAANLTLEPSSVISPTGRNIIPTIQSTRPPLPATLEEIRLRVDVTERSFMEVTIDGDVVFSGNALNGDSFEWTAEQEATILTGNAIGLIVTINDVELGRLGDRGQNLEETWRVTN